MSRAQPWVAAALLALSCAPAATVRPGGQEAPCVFHVHSSAQAVLLSGTMTDWRSVPLVRRGRDFELSLQLPPGRYEYRLEEQTAAGPRAVVPPGAERAADGFGGENLMLRVR